jgi:hypothetical protein
VTSRQSYTIAEPASEQERQELCGIVLRVVWADLSWLDIDLEGCEEDSSMATAVAALDPYRRRSLLSRRPTVTAHVVPGKDDAMLEMLVKLAGKTTGSTGLSRDEARVIYEANDCGTSCVFKLADDQRHQVERTLRIHGHRDHLLVAWTGRRGD